MNAIGIGARIDATIARIVLVCCIGLLGGCLKGTDDLRDFVAREKAKPGKPLDPLPVLKTFETFEYKDQNQRDPFAPSAAEMADEEANKAIPDPHPREKLEDYPLDALKMVGTLGTDPHMEALVKDPDGTVNRVHVNNYLGQNNGKIVAIGPARIDIVELMSNGNGGWIEHPTSIELGAK